MKLTDLNPIKTFVYLAKSIDKDEFWDRELDGYSKQMCFRDNINDESDIMYGIISGKDLDIKACKEWFNKQKPYWNARRKKILEDNIYEINDD